MRETLQPFDRGIPGDRLPDPWLKRTDTYDLQRYRGAKAPPRPQKRFNTLLRGQPADIDGISAASCSRTGIRINEVGLNRDLVCGKPPLDKLSPAEFAQGDICVHHVAPRSQQAMRCDHCCDSGAGGATVAVATA